MTAPHQLSALAPSGGMTLASDQLAALAPSIYTAVSRLMATEGVPATVQRLGMRRETVLRLAAGGDTHEATLLLAAVRLGLLTIAPLPMALSTSGLPTA